MSDHEDRAPDVAHAIDEITRPRRPYTKSPAAAVRPANLRPIAEVIEADFEPVAPPPRAARVGTVRLADPSRAKEFELTVEDAPRETLASLRRSLCVHLAATLDAHAADLRCHAARASTPKAERVAALADATRHAQTAESHRLTLELGRG